MSAARDKRNARTPRRRPSAVASPFADDWWELDVPTAPVPDHPDGIRRRRARSMRGKRFRIGRRIVAMLRERHSVSPRFRKVITSGVVMIGVIFAFALSVGVIVLNNIVISRSAELGRLDTERTGLRTENAQLNAEIARLSAPPRIVRVARKQLGMSEPTVATKFIWLSQDNALAAAAERRREAQRIARQERAAAREDVVLPVYSGPDEVAPASNTNSTTSATPAASGSKGDTQ